jgi:hypothetical protein
MQHHILCNICNLYYRKAAHALQSALAFAKHAPRAPLLTHIIWGRDLQAERSDALEKARKYMPHTTAATVTDTASAATAAASASAGSNSSGAVKVTNSSSSSSSGKGSSSQQQQQPQQQPTAVVGAQLQSSAVREQQVQQSEVPQWLRSSYDDAVGGSSSGSSSGKKRGRDSNVQAVEERAKQCLAKARPHFPQ